MFKVKRSSLILCLFICSFLFSFSVRNALAQKVVELKQWQFYEKGSKKKKPARVPGSVISDLLLNGLIPDPYKNLNEEKVKWIEEKSWVYSTTFLHDAVAGKKYEIVFEGLDTYAKVWLNDTLILSSRNMFLEHRVSLAGKLKQGLNQIVIEFSPAVTKAGEEKNILSLPYPGDERIYCRKAQYQFGWDWGPRLVNCGIWKPVYLREILSLPEPEIKLSSEVLNDSLANIHINLSFLSSTEKNASVFIEIPGVKISERFLIKMKNGKNLLHYQFPIKNPRLWWCNESGKPFLYSIKLELSDDKESRKFDLKHGIRTVKLNLAGDKSGNKFSLELNGKEIFCKGANYIPPDALKPLGEKNEIRKILLNAVNNHMNLIRVWGGGVYPPSCFYDLCDSLGIMVWQDFMFACAMYPFDNSNKKEIEEEITQQIFKYRNHPSLVIWCGNNENYEGWTNWGWQKQYKISPADSVKIGNQYLELFNVLMPTLVNRLDQGKPYRSTSPENGWGRPLAYIRGDVHYWGVWWGMAPLESYRQKTGRFMSEYGFQALPAVSTIKKMGKPFPRDWKSPLLRAHQKHPKGFETIEHYQKNYFRVHHLFEKSVYLSQVLQAYSMETAIMAHRGAKPFCMGSVYWQMNDCWPVVSWSATDYFHQKKAAQYSVQKSFINILPVIEKKEDKIVLSVVSDSLSDAEGKLRLTQYNLNGRVENDQIFQIQIAANQKNTIKVFDEKYFLPAPIDSLKTILVARLFINEKEYSSDYYLFCRPNQLMLQESKIKQELRPVTEGWQLTLLSEVPALWVNIKTPENIELSEDYFHLLPFEEKTILLKNNSTEEKKPTIKTSSLYENMH